DLLALVRSDKPTLIEEHTTAHGSADLVGLIDALGEEQAFIVGQDFGAGVVWDTAMRYPARLRGVTAGVPLTSRYQMPAMFDTKPLGREMFLHVNYFQEPGV